MASVSTPPQRTPPTVVSPSLPWSQVSKVKKGVPDNEVINGLDDLDSSLYLKRFSKYDAEYSHFLMAKYYRANIFDEKKTVENQIIGSGRFQCVHSYADPEVGFEDQSSNGSNNAH